MRSDLFTGTDVEGNTEREATSLSRPDMVL